MIDDPFQNTILLALFFTAGVGTIASGVVATRRRGIVVGVAAATTWLAGVAAVGSGGAHLVGVIWTATYVRLVFYWDFRFGALLLLGMMIVLAGALCVTAVRGLTRGEAYAWDRALSGSLLLTIVTAPFLPVQPELASGLVFIGGMNLIVLVGARVTSTYVR